VRRSADRLFRSASDVAPGLDPAPETRLLQSTQKRCKWNFDSQNHDTIVNLISSCTMRKLLLKNSLLSSNLGCYVSSVLVNQDVLTPVMLAEHFQLTRHASVAKSPDRLAHASNDTFQHSISHHLRYSRLDYCGRSQTLPAMSCRSVALQLSAIITGAWLCSRATNPARAGRSDR
jgi:hypothetical protein